MPQEMRPAPLDMPPPATECQAAGADDILVPRLAGRDEVSEAAAAAGMSERTAYRRLAQPGFRQKVAEVRGRLVARAHGRLAAGMTEAADALRGLVASRDECVRHQAARTLLEMAVRFH